MLPRWHMHRTSWDACLACDAVAERACPSLAQHIVVGTREARAVCRELDIVEAPLFDLEVRGVPALQYFGSRVWNTVPQERH